MAFFDWDPARFALNVTEMDAEHQLIIGCMNRLHELREAKAARADLAKAMDALMKITVKHFSDEEAYMAKIGYPDLPNHRNIHKNLLEKMDGHKAEFERSGALTDDFFVFLKMWLKSHICGIDVQYAKFNRAA